MKFKLLKKVTGVVNTYGQKCETGGIIELTGHFIDKARNNPDLQEVRTSKKVSKNGKQTGNATTSG